MVLIRDYQIDMHSYTEFSEFSEFSVPTKLVLLLGSCPQWFLANWLFWCPSKPTKVSHF